jgi:hypothetical protein
LTQERYAGYRLKLKIKAENATDQATKDAINAQLDMVDAVQKDLADAPEVRLGFLNMLSKTLDDPKAAMALQSFPRMAAVAAKEFFTAGELQAAMMEDMRTSKDAVAEMAAMGINNSTYAPVNEFMTLEAKFMKGSLDERMKLADAEQKMKNKATQDYTDLQIANRKSRDVFQDLLNAGIPKITAAMKGAATATDAVTGAMEKIAEKMGITVKKREEPGASPTAEARPAAPRPVAEGVRVSGSAEARASAEKYFGKAISDAEFSALIKATHAEAAGGKQASQQEQAMIMASVLNRARTDQGGIMGALTAKNQFQSVTGTANAPGPSEHYLKGPEAERLKSIEGATKLLENISLQQKNFTAADAKAYGPGTNIGYRDKMLAAGGTVIGGSVFQTAPLVSNRRDESKQATMPAGPTTDNRWGEPKQATTPAGPAPAANGGIIRATPGGVNVLAAEAGKNEAFVPLPDGKTIPVQMVNNEQQMSMMAAQLDRLDQMVRIMQNQVGVSEQILKYAQ